MRIACHINEFKECLPASKWLKQQGYLVGFNLMQVADRSLEEITLLAQSTNDYPIDVLIKYNLSEDYTSGLRENGWNIFSKNTVSRFLQELILDKQVESFDFHNFELKRELLERDDKVRSWTERKIDGRLQITNGLMILQPHAILEIKKAL